MASSSRKCFPLTVVHIFFYSALSCLLPFLNLHARDLGLTSWETSLANLAAAVLSGLGSLAFFSLARACGRLKLISVICLVFSALAYTSLILIPRVVRIPRHPLMEFDCSAAIRLEKCSNWKTCADATLASVNFTSFKLSDCQYVCRPAGQQDVPHALDVCFRNDGGSFCEVYDDTANVRNTSVDFQSRFPSWYFDDLRQVPASEFLSYEEDKTTPTFIDVCSYKPVWPLVVNQKNYDDIYCRPASDGCQIKCKVSIDGEPGPSHCLQILGNPVLTFWAYLSVRAVADTFLLSSVVLLDFLVVLAINDFNGFYGRSRLWPSLGLALFPVLTGFLVDYYSSSAGRPDYSPSVFIYDGLILVTCAVVIALRLDTGYRGQYVVNSPSKSRPFWSLELGVIFVMTLVLGTLWGVLDTFLRPLFVEIGCSKLIVGGSAGLPFLCSLPFLAVSKNLVRNIGKAHLLVFAFLFYAIRFAGLSFVVYPLWTFPFQAMETFTLVIAWIALVAYAHSLVSKTNHATAHFVLYLLHFSAGRALGVSVGAFLEQVVGIPWAFRGLAFFCLAQGLLYLLLHHTCIKKRRRRNRTSFIATSNGGALFPMAERRPNGDALYGKDQANLQASRPMIDSDQEDDK